MARKAFVVNEALRERVRHLSGLGIPQDDIAKIIGCAPKTLRKRFRDELDRGDAEANATIAGYLFAAAKGGNVTAMIFWMKTRANWQERKVANDPVSVTDIGLNSEVLVLPDNTRDPELTQVLRDAQKKYFARKQQGWPAHPVSCVKGSRISQWDGADIEGFIEHTEMLVSSLIVRRFYSTLKLYGISLMSTFCLMNNCRQPGNMQQGRSAQSERSSVALYDNGPNRPPGDWLQAALVRGALRL